MTRTDIDVKSMGAGRSHRRASLRRLLILPVALLLAAALATSALAATSTNKEGLSGYKHPTTAKKETQPSKNKEVPHEEPTTTPTTTPAPAKASALPFTGFDLRWTVGFGLLLMGAGGSIVMVQRRQRRSGGR
jgi:hypothetical protein